MSTETLPHRAFEAQPGFGALGSAKSYCHALWLGLGTKIFDILDLC